jgi:hypothetical protein
MQKGNGGVTLGYRSDDATHRFGCAVRIAARRLGVSQKNIER